MHPEFRFWSRVDIREDNECWNWYGGKFKNGYGRFMCNGNRCYRVHRFSLELKLGRKLKPRHFNEYALHTCDNPACVNPNHLFLGTSKDNVRDMMKKGRDNWKRGMDHKGIKGPNVKLDECSVKMIRAMWNKGDYTQHYLAKLFDVSRGAITGIIYRSRWKHI